MVKTETVVGIRNCLAAIETIVELKSQSTRIRSRFSQAEYDQVTGNLIVALKKLNSELESQLTEE